MPYHRLDADVDKLIAAGFDELDTYWFVNPDDIAIQMPNSPYASELAKDDIWNVYSDRDTTPDFLKPCLTLDEALKFAATRLTEETL